MHAPTHWKQTTIFRTALSFRTMSYPVDKSAEPLCSVFQFRHESSVQQSVMATSRLFGQEDYAKHWDPAGYARAFYAKETQLLKWVLTNLREIYHTMPVGDGRLLDIGTGPILSYLLAAAPTFSSIYVSDFSASNLDVLNRFVSGQWDNHLQATLDTASSILEVENGKALEQKLQSSIKGTVKQQNGSLCLYTSVILLFWYVTMLLILKVFDCVVWMHIKSYQGIHIHLQPRSRKMELKFPITCGHVKYWIKKRWSQTLENFQ